MLKKIPASARHIPLQDSRILRAKTPYSVRRVPRAAMSLLLPEGVPRPGDLVLARVDKLGQHRHLELTTGRRARLFQGDEIVLAYGNRYAPDQFEAEVPVDLGACHMVAAGGIASRMLSHHRKISNATGITPLGLIAASSGHVLNLRQFALERSGLAQPPIPTYAVVGTSMNAGKTETAAHIVRGLSLAGYKVGAAKLTGTGAGGDVWSLTDAGASMTLDFTDAGFSSTYLAQLADLEEILAILTSQLHGARMDCVVLEVADGLFQRETSMLLESPCFARAVNGLVFASPDAMGALAGTRWLQERGLPVLAVSGRMTASPLAAREAQSAVNLPVLDLEALSRPEIAEMLGMYQQTTGILEQAL